VDLEKARVPHAVFFEIGRGLLGREDAVAEPGQRLGGADEAALGFLAAEGQEDVLFRQAESCRQDGLEIGLVDVFAETGDLSGRGHLDAEDRVGALEPGERELGRLDADIVQVERRLAVADGPAHHRGHGQLDEVRPGHLADERERPRGPGGLLETEHDPPRRVGYGDESSAAT